MSESHQGNASKNQRDVEVLEKPKRRSYSAEYKLQILEQAAALKDTGAIGAMLRQEGLYHSRLTEWRQQKEAGALKALGQRRGPKQKHHPLESEVERLRRENERLKEKLEQAELVIEIQKKISEILGIPLKSPRVDESASIRPPKK